ncbi:glycosyltransferase WbuB [Bradyrhizobium sp. MOS001]|uniref:glycosyltransferase family 4 protein n=1 Tax=Bradyrhizobium sp. MOS001 TaxID=2133948 RepID=UPI00107577EC|nr:glycosyltransferase family 4 protein [Bradyrhizobium sp. MOS001]TFW58614.1 glycosyltransferase WbuB [Bradyrhizobium sp. MOS001]
MPAMDQDSYSGAERIETINDAAQPSDRRTARSATRLLFIVDTGFPTFRADVSSLFGTYLPRHGVLTDLVAEADGDGGTWEAGDVFLTHRRRSRLRLPLRGFFHDIGALWGAKRNRYSAIQIRNKVFASVFGILRARWLGIPFYYWMSFPMADAALRVARERGRSQGFLKWLILATAGYAGREVLNRFVLPWASHVFVQSDKMKADLAAQGIDPSRMTPVPMGVDPERFRLDTPAQPDPRLSGRHVIAYLGTCERMRRIDFLFEVVAAVAAADPLVTLLIIGDAPDGPDQAWLRRRVDETGATGRVVITGWLPQEAAQAHLATADVCLALMPPDPLLDSTTPTKLVEYLAMGKPVVANDHPDQRKVIDESGAGFCTDLDTARYAEAVGKLLSDPALRQSMASRGRTYVLENRSYDTIARRLAATYEKFARRPTGS